MPHLFILKEVINLSKKKKITITEKRRKNLIRAITRSDQYSSAVKEMIKTASPQKIRSLSLNRNKKLKEYKFNQGEEKAQKYIINREQKQREREEKKQKESRYYDFYDDYDYTPDYDRSIIEKINDDGYYYDKENGIYWDKTSLYDEGENLYENIISIIEENSLQGGGQFGIHFKNKLDEYISAYGKSDTLLAIGIAPDEFKEDAQKVLYYSGDASKLDKGLTELENHLAKYFSV